MYTSEWNYGIYVIVVMNKNKKTCFVKDYQGNIYYWGSYDECEAMIKELEKE